MKRTAVFFLLSFFIASTSIYAQGTFSGDLMMNMNFYQKDTNIGASGNPLYDNALSGSDAWLSLRYNINGFTFFARADVFNNSNLKVPVAANTDFGIGAWSITKDMNDLTITVGSIYDQVGSGILFRSYEDRGLLIDNALTGIELKYKLTDKIMLKGFTGQQKNNSQTNNLVNNQRYLPVIKGFNAEGDFDAGKMHLVPGIGVLNRTLDAASMKSVADNINGMDTTLRFNPRYNMYAFTAYNTLVYKNLSWYVEGAYKTHEAIEVTTLSDPLNGKFADRAGNVEYTSINYGRKGIALSLNGRRTENFTMRTSPSEKLLQGMLNWQPVVGVLRSQRLMSRYSPVSQDQSEMAGMANLSVSLNDLTNLNGTYVTSNDLDGNKLYRELFGEINYQGQGKWTLEGGVQYLEYNILRNQNRSASASAPILYALTPFAEVGYRISAKRSIRFEAQYMESKQDYGSWLFALIEYNISPTWSFALSDMYNIVPNPDPDNIHFKDPGNHYYNIFAAYTKGPHRFTLAYVKQVDGMNCTGGVCRYEPAFSGVKGTLSTSF